MANAHRVAVIGHTGRGNYGHGIDTVWLRIKECEVVAVADPDPAGLSQAASRLKAPKSYADYRRMLDEVKPEIVAIGPRWADQHRDMAIAAAERGAHIYMEKPFCRSPAEADEIIAACEKADVKLAVAHQTRYSPKLQAVRDVIASGQIGDVLELRGRGKEDARGGSEDLWVLGSHVLNLVRYFGGEPRWCFATITEKGEPIRKAHLKEGAEGLGPLAGDTVNAVYGMDRGITAYFGSKRGAVGNRFGLQIFGSKGVIEILTGHMPSAMLLPDPSWSPGRTGKKWMPISSSGVGKAETIPDGGLDGGNEAAVRDLLSAIAADRQPECNMYEARSSIEMICAVFESQRVGGPVTFPLQTRRNPLSMLS